uniref:Uncharacterized protein n=1 Tax=Manihot esculenta TaxID=3983 RepID=A0A2C9U9I9_MANES
MIQKLNIPRTQLRKHFPHQSSKSKELAWIGLATFVHSPERRRSTDHHHLLLHKKWFGPEELRTPTVR